MCPLYKLSVVFQMYTGVETVVDGCGEEDEAEDGWPEPLIDVLVWLKERDG